MKKKNPIVTICITGFILCSLPQLTMAEENKGFEVTSLQTEAALEQCNLPLRIWNKKESFSSVINQDTYIFLVGNNNYNPISRLPPLKECGNDVDLMKSLFINCSHIPEENIYAYKDLTLQEWKDYFEYFTAALGRNSMAIIFYSGHGGRDGSLIFTDGGRLPPEALRSEINSFPNDTVLLLDACYSGSNDGLLPIKGQPFKANCRRIYAALAHQQAKEILYKEEPFFTGITGFYEEVLQMSQITGNGYFTALIGLFFGEYHLAPFENISFTDLIFNITQNHISYIEYTRSRMNDEPVKKGLPVIIPQNRISENQIPKIIPADDKEVMLKVPSHHYIIYQRSSLNPRHTENHFSLNIFPAASIPSGKAATVLAGGLETIIGMDYNIFCNPGIFGFGLTVGAGVAKSGQETEKEAHIYSFPLALNCRYLFDFDTPFFALIDFDAGIFPILIDLKEKPAVFACNEFISPGLYLGWSFSSHIYLTAGIKAGLISLFSDPEKTVVLWWPGINLIYNFN